MRIATPNQLKELKNTLCRKRQAEKKPCLTLCGGTGCRAYGCLKVVEAFKEGLAKEGLSTTVDLRVTGCHGFCERGPLMVLHPEKIFYQRLKVEDVPEVISRTIRDGEVIERLCYKGANGERVLVREDDIPFYRKQERVLFNRNEHLDPTTIYDYIALDGYSALSKVLCEKNPEELIEEIKRSGLRGRGGGGFPTGKKWESCRKAHGEPKYVICNADEGDPGAYMDRSLLEGNPHGVLEGMLIGAYAIGAHEGYVYVRLEYPLAVAHLRKAIEQAHELGLLGNDILGSSLAFEVKIEQGAGAFVCGEETALIASIEGRIGEPWPRPPFPAEQGLFSRPTCINNVETWANVPLIINKGSQWFSSIGTEKSKGTKVFSLVGKVQNTGLVEVPMGITLREIIFDIGGGIPKGKRFKAVQTGGPSGGCVPESMLDLPVDYERLTEAGSIMGSGGMVVMDEDTCMVDMARYFLAFTTEESCGKCTPCREGTRRMLQILTSICQGKAMRDDLPSLRELAQGVKEASLCGLGSTAPNPVLTTLAYFMDEYMAHIEERRCPARTCKELIQYLIVEDKCMGCGLCQMECPQQAISGLDGGPLKIVASTCIKCGLCLEVCPADAIEVR